MPQDTITVEMFGGPFDGAMMELDKPTPAVEIHKKQHLHLYMVDEHNALKYLYGGARLPPQAEDGN